MAQRRFLAALERPGRVIVGAVAIWALATPLEAAAVSPLMLIAGAALGDMMIPIYNVSARTFRLAHVPKTLLGRVNSASGLLSSGSDLLGTAGGGLLIGLLGPRTVLWIIAGGLGLSALAAGLTDLRRQ